jgi:cytochrome P450
MVRSLNKKFVDYKKSFDPKPSIGLTVNDTPVWRPHRKLIEPAFNSAILKSFLPIFNEKAMICMDKLGEKVGEFNISQFWDRLSLDNILTTSLGINDNVQLEKHNEYLQHAVE